MKRNTKEKLQLPLGILWSLLCAWATPYLISNMSGKWYYISALFTAVIIWIAGMVCIDTYTEGK